MITEAQLKHIVPAIKASNLSIYVPLLNLYMPKYQINTKARIASFLANLAQESGSFNYTKEIASGAAYEGRGDLGNTQSGDGVRFRGRGLIQCTGRAMYKACSLFLYEDQRLLNNPELLEQPDAATESACWFWSNVKKLNQIADKPDDWTATYKKKIYSRFEWIVLRINGGQTHIAERKAFLQKALEVL